MEHLSTDVVHVILSFCGAEALCACQSLCRAWRDLPAAGRDLRWRRLYEGCWPPPPSPSLASWERTFAAQWAVQAAWRAGARQRPRARLRHMLLQKADWGLHLRAGHVLLASREALPALLTVPALAFRGNPIRCGLLSSAALNEGDEPWFAEYSCFQLAVTDWRTGCVVWQLKHLEPASTVALTRVHLCAPWLVASHPRAGVRCWHLPTGTLVSSFPRPGCCEETWINPHKYCGADRFLALDVAGRHLWLWDEGGQLSLFVLASGAQLYSERLEEGTTVISWRARNCLLIATDHDLSVRRIHVAPAGVETERLLAFSTLAGFPAGLSDWKWTVVPQTGRDVLLLGHAANGSYGPDTELWFCLDRPPRVGRYPGRVCHAVADLRCLVTLDDRGRLRAHDFGLPVAPPKVSSEAPAAAPPKQPPGPGVAHERRRSRAVSRGAGQSAPRSRRR